MSFRAKLLAIVGIAAIALIAVTVASALISEEVSSRLTTIENVYVPRVELGPRLDGELTRLARRFQDAVAAHDLDMVANTRETRDALLAHLSSAGTAIDTEQAATLRRAIEDYYASASDVSRRLIEGEIGEPIIEDMALMQRRQKVAANALKAATLVDRDALAAAFGAAASAETTASEVRLGVSAVFLALALGFSLLLARTVLRSFDALSAGFERFGEGAFDARIPIDTHDELGAVARQANQMAASLARAAAERDRGDWLKAGIAGLSEELRGELDPEDAATLALRFLARYLDLPAAALYYADGVPDYALLAHHALAESQAGTATVRFRPGEGLVGAAALRRELMVVSSLPTGYLRVRSGLGEAVPQAIALLPLVYADRVTGVLELASFAPWSDLHSELLRQVHGPLAVALHVAHRRRETQALLAETRAQAQRLADQDEELRATNEELHVQQEELSHSNAELKDQTKVLERQQRELEERHVALEEARATLEQKASELGMVSAYKSQFLTNMSHELRTPLNSMLLLSNLLAENDDGNLTDKQVEYCSTIHAAGTDLLGLINQVLDLARVESGKHDLEMAPARLTEVAARARRVFEPQARKEGLTLAVVVEDDVPERIVTDQRRVDQVLTNLLGNAIKFTPKGTVTLRISRPAADASLTRPGLAPGAVVALAVHDTGPGIPPEERERIFSPFEQIDPRPDRRYGGTGLGLALANELVTLLGGELQLASEVGRGSIFTCYLPIDATAVRGAEAPAGGANGDAPQPDAQPEPAAAVASTPENEPCLLVIEDEDLFAGTLANLVGASGLRCVRARDGVTGIAMARALRPRGIVLDVRLPDLDGFAVLHALRADPVTRGIPIHFASAVDDADRGLAMGAIGYLVKPASRRELERMVSALAAKPMDRVGVLVVEDDRLVGDSLARLLIADGITVEQATSAAQAVAAIRARHFDCVILDLGLPDMDGLDLLEQLHGERSDLPPVVISTARSLTREETRRLEQYAETIVLKDGASADRVLNEVRLFVRRIREGFDPHRARGLTMERSEARLDGRRILVVDDDMRTVYALSAALRSKGAEVFVADTGQAALKALARHRGIEIVLMDIMMPEMDGYEAIRHIRSQAQYARLPIIALTAKAMKGDAEKCLAAGATDYLPKPIDADRLLGLLAARLIEGGGGRAAP